MCFTIVGIQTANAMNCPKLQPDLLLMFTLATTGRKVVMYPHTIQNTAKLANTLYTLETALPILLFLHLLTFSKALHPLPSFSPFTLRIKPPLTTLPITPSPFHSVPQI